MTKIKLLGAAAVLVAGLGAASSAQAYDGCGWGYHANAWGACRPNDRPVGFYAPRPVYGYGYGYRPYRPGFHVSFRPF